jgi:hypothetical protein
MRLWFNVNAYDLESCLCITGASPAGTAEKIE